MPADLPYVLVYEDEYDISTHGPFASEDAAYSFARYVVTDNHTEVDWPLHAEYDETIAERLQRASVRVSVCVLYPPTL